MREAVLLRYLLLFFLAASVAHSQSPRVMVVPKAALPIVIDGRLSEVAWKTAGMIPEFQEYRGSAALRNQTQVRLLYDSQALYIAYRCKEADISRIRAQVTDHDGSVWDDDCAEFFLDVKADRASFAQFILNTIGTRYDGLGHDSYGYNPKWEGKSVVGKDEWTAEIRIPFSELGVNTPESGDLWLGNFCREEQPSRELSCWSPTMGSFAAPGRFGAIVFGSLEDRIWKETGLVPAVSTEEKSRGDYVIWETTPWRHFEAKMDLSKARETAAIQAIVLEGQIESKAIMVSNLTDETLSARLLLEGLPEVEMLIPTFVRTADGRPFPDALVPPDPVGQLIVPPGETRQIWLNIKGMKPGKFEGRLTISPLTASTAEKEVKLTVEVVHPPIKPPEPLAFTWDYLGDAALLGLEKEYVQSMVDHGIRVFMISGLRQMPRPNSDDEGNFLEPVDWSNFEREVKLKWQPGRKLYINLDVWEKSEERKIYNGKFDSPGWRIAFKKIMSGMVDELRKLGLSYDDYFVCPVDECIDDRYIAIARLVKEVDPKIRVVSDSAGNSLEEIKEADKYTDLWIPHFSAFFADWGKEARVYLKSTGKPLGFYFYSEGDNEKAQDSYQHYLWRFWFAYSQGLNGVFGYWTATQHYGNPWNRHQTTAAYDPSLFYPGNGCVITGRRWEAWRRGVEDLALLSLCKSVGIETSSAVKSVLDAPNDRDAASEAREGLVRALGNVAPAP
jgi:hypothetical protein